VKRSGAAELCCEEHIDLDGPAGRFTEDYAGIA
jgi:hypothetical protein